MMRSRVFGWASRRQSAVWGAVVLVFAMTGTAGATAGAMLHLGVSNTSSATTTLKSPVNGAVLQLTNTNTAGGTNARALGITVPAGRAPIRVNPTAGKATNLDVDKLDGLDSTAFMRGNVRADAWSVPRSNTFWIDDEPGSWTLYYDCPALQSSNGELWLRNDSGGVAFMFYDNGGANPHYVEVGDGVTQQLPTSASGERYGIWIHEGSTNSEISVLSVHRSSDCLVQFQAVTS